MTAGRFSRFVRRRVAVLAACLLLSLPPQAAAEPGGARSEGRSSALALLEMQMRQLFDDVSHIPPERVAGLMVRRPGHVVLIDVRTPEEYAVSRIPGAVRVDPESRSAAEVAALAGGLDDKVVVAYCSIGLRSARLLVRIGQALKERGARELHNLEGGVFRWRNERRPLVAERGATEAVHPHNWLWRQFLLDDPGT
jgi:rhodanese-related sulfurtransferase